MWEGNGTALNICEVKVEDVMPSQFIEYFTKPFKVIHMSKETKEEVDCLVVEDSKLSPK